MSEILLSGATALEQAIIDLITGIKDYNTNQWIREPEPFYGNLLTRLCRKIVNSETKGPLACPTAMVCVYQNSVWLVVNRDMFDKLTRVERVSIIKHEAQHIAHRHLFRFKEGRHSNMIRANIAMDAVINQYNSDLPAREIEGYTEPGEPFEPVSYKKIKGAQENGTWEHYYELLEQEADDGAKQTAGGFTTTKYGDMFDEHKHFGQSVDGESNMDMVEENTKKTIRETARGLKPGDVSGELQNILDEISAESKIPWQVLLRRWMKMSQKRTRELNILRESLSVPGVFPGHKRVPVPEFDVYADMSGSVGDDQATAFFKEVMAIQRQMKADVWLHQFDTCIHKSEKIDKLIPQIEREGYGGTSFQCIVNHARENKKRNIIIMTDGFASPVDTSGLNVLWVYTENHQDHEGKGIVLDDV